jgi:ketosteroid isomerase-like protein
MREKYESAGHVVYSGKVKAITESGGVLEVVCAAVTTIITVKAGKVVEHRDYVDYTIYENSDWAENLGCGN